MMGTYASLKVVRNMIICVAIGTVLGTGIKLIFGL